MHHPIKVINVEQSVGTLWVLEVPMSMHDALLLLGIPWLLKYVCQYAPLEYLGPS